MPALLAGAAVIAASLLTTVPAASAAPIAESAGAAAAAAPATVEYAGTFAALPDENGGHSVGNLAMFQVPGYGYLTIDSTGVSQTDALGTKVVTFTLPTRFTLSGTAHARFDKLATESVKHPLTVASVRSGLTLGKQTAALVNQTPAAPATHRIYAVLVSPNNRAKAPNQTAAKVATSVAHANDYWSQQSGGTIHFALAGTTAWYKTSTTCKTQAGATALWNSAAAVAKSQLGYVAGKNNHLVLFFPSDTGNDDCGASIGLGTIGSSVNAGGLTWVLGTDAPIEQATLVHELGHNLSLGHADWLNCNTLNPNGGFFGFDGTNGGTGTGCLKKNYGDETDVMGFGQSGIDGGALSSAQGIRSGIWGPESPTTWETVAGTGSAQSFDLNPVSGNTGLRAVVVQDDDGVNYFVEYRNFTDEDAQFAGSPGCSLNYCIAQNPGVRILRLENNAYKFEPTDVPNGILGLPGDDSLLIGHYDNGGQSNYDTVGDTFWSKGASGIKIEVTAVSNTGATVEVTKNGNTATPDVAYIYKTSTYDTKMRVGDVWTMMAGSKYDGETTTFKWYRNPTAGVNDVAITPANEIPGATSQSYKIQAADVGHYIRAVMTGSSPSGGSTYNVDPDVISSNVHRTYGYGPISTGIYTADDPGTVSVTSGTPLVATASNYPSGSTFTYQWYSGSSATTATTALSGQTTAFHTLTAADAGKFLRVRIIASIPGYTGLVGRFSPAKNYSIIKNAGLPLLSSTRQIGTTITADTSAFVYTDAQGGSLTPSLAKQWLRSGAAIPGATGDSYALSSADFGKPISFRVTATQAGLVPHVVTSAAITPNVKGNLAVGTTPVVATPGVTTLSVTPVNATDVTPSADKSAIQWYRGAAKITGQTAATYKLTTADVGQDVTARITYSRLGYNDLVQTASTGADTNKWWLQDDVGAPKFTGNPAIGQTLTITPHTYTNMHTGAACAAACITVKDQWLRNGAAITGTDATNNDGHYTLTAADKSAAISVRVTVSSGTFPYLLPSVGTSASVGPFGTSFFPDWQDAATVTASGATLTAHSGVDDPTATNTYQWYRGTTAVAGQTHQTFPLTDADHDTQLWVKVTSKKTNFTTAVTLSVPTNYGVYGPAGPFHVFPQGGSLGDAMHVGDVVTTEVPDTADGTFENHAGDPYNEVDLTRTYEWYRSGVRITGLNASVNTYALQAADLGKTISVKIRVHASGGVDYVSLSKTQDAAQKVLIGTFDLSALHPEVTTSSSHVATVALVGAPVPTGAKLSYRWLRDGAVLTPQVKASYTLTSVGTGKLVQVSVTMSKPGYTTVTFPRVDANRINVGTAAPDATINLTTRQAAVTFTGTAVTPGPYSKSYAWYRNGARIAGAAAPTFTLATTDTDKSIQVVVTLTRTGYETYSYSPLLTNTFSSSGDVSVTGPSGTVYTCTAPTYTKADGTTVLNAPTNGTLAYQWLLDGSPIGGQTSSTYDAAANSGHSLSCTVTVGASLHKTLVDTSATPVAIP